MKITSENFINYNATAIFFFVIATQIFPAFSFMGNTNYLTYIVPVAIIFCLWVTAYNLKLDSQITLDYILVFLIYYLINCLVLVELDFFKSSNAVRFIAIPILFICFYIIFKNIENNNVFILSLKGLVLFAVIQALIGLSQAIFGVPFFENILSAEEAFDFERNYFAFIFPSISRNAIQATGTFSHFIALGVFLVICIPIAYTLWKETKNKLWLLAFMIIWIGIIVTFSRGALLGGALGTLIVYFSYTKRKVEKILISILAGSIIYILFSPVIENYSSQTSNFSGRYETWMFSINYAMKHPENLIFGYGFSNIREVLAAQNKVYTNFHSSYVQMFLELGLVGTFFFFFGIYFLIKNIINVNTTWSFCLLAIVISFLFTQFFEQHLYGFHGIVFFIIVGLFQANMEKSDAPLKM